VVLVGVNLTLLCAGHDEGTHHTVPHLTLLGEPDEGAHEAHRPSEPRATTPTLLAAGLLETLALALVDVLLVAGLVLARPAWGRAARRDQQPGRPQTILLPERRPPRLVPILI
jgi:hypothetical protein